MATAGNPQVNFLSRDFQSIRNDLTIFLQAFYPDVWRDFNVSSPGMAMVDLNAYVADLLSFIADKKYNENYLDGIQERKSAYRLAKTLGYKPPGFRPAITVVDIFIQVPPTADGPDPQYLPIYRQGMQIKGSGQIFETDFNIDFSSDFSEEGTANRKIEPVFNGSQDVIGYKITKREKCTAGLTRIFAKEITAAESVPFLRVFLPENNVLSITNTIVINQLGLTQLPTFQQFNDPTLQYYEVEFLPQNKIFVEDPIVTEINGIPTGKLMQVEKRFESSILADGSCVLRFGSGTPDYSAYEDYLRTATIIGNQNTINTSALLDNTALGQLVPPNSTIFVKYRTGGGLSSNVGSNVLTQVSNIDAVILGTDPTLNQQVLQSTRAINPIPAVGGIGLPSVDEILQQAGGNFASQDRAVTLPDYLAKAAQIPGKFGAPFRTSGEIDDNKVKLYILTQDANGKLNSVSTNVVKSNLATFLTQYRMINDFVEISDGKVVNLQFEVDLYVDKTFNVNEVKLEAINAISSFMDITTRQMGEGVYVSQITQILREIPGIINVVEIRTYNMEGGGYSNTIIDQANLNRVLIPSTGGYRTQIEYIDNTIFCPQLAMFEVKFPNSDILLRTN